MSKSYYCGCIGCGNPATTYAFTVLAHHRLYSHEYVRWQRLCSMHADMYKDQMFRTRAEANAYIVTTKLSRN